MGYGSVIKRLPRVDKALPVRQRKEGEMDFRTVISKGGRSLERVLGDQIRRPQRDSQWTCHHGAQRDI